MRTRPGNLPGRAPSVAEPERFRCGGAQGAAQLTPSVSAALRRCCFPESHPPAVRLPERFRGGCAFGAGFQCRTGLSRRVRLSCGDGRAAPGPSQRRGRSCIAGIARRACPLTCARKSCICPAPCSRISPAAAVRAAFWRWLGICGCAELNHPQKTQAPAGNAGGFRVSEPPSSGTPAGGRHAANRTEHHRTAGPVRFPDGDHEPPGRRVRGGTRLMAARRERQGVSGFYPGLGGELPRPLPGCDHQGDHCAGLPAPELQPVLLQRADDPSREPDRSGERAAQEFLHQLGRGGDRGCDQARAQMGTRKIAAAPTR